SSGVTSALKPDGKSKEALMLVASAEPLFINTIARMASPSPGSVSFLAAGGSGLTETVSEDVLAATDPSATESVQKESTNSNLTTPSGRSASPLCWALAIGMDSWMAAANKSETQAMAAAE